MSLSAFRTLTVCVSVLFSTNALFGQSACPTYASVTGSSYSGTLPNGYGLSRAPNFTTALDVTGNQGTYEAFLGGSTPINTQTSGTLSSYSPFPIPGTSGYCSIAETVGCSFSTNAGVWSSDTYPSNSAFGVWPKNNSSSMTTLGTPSGSSCSPGINCDVCETSASDGDCWGQLIPRNPTSLMRSGQFSSSVGFQYTGYVSGAGSAPSSPGTPITAAAFWHQSPVYLGGQEYGLYSYFGTYTGTVYFYYDNYSNCSDFVGNSICASTEGGAGMGNVNYTTSNFGACSLNNNAENNDTYTVYPMSYNSNVYFFVNAVKPNSTEDGSGPWLVGPVPAGIGTSSSTAGYVTTGVTRFDPSGNGNYTGVPPSLTVASVYVGN